MKKKKSKLKRNIAIVTTVLILTSPFWLILLSMKRTQGIANSVYSQLHPGMKVTELIDNRDLVETVMQGTMSSISFGEENKKGLYGITKVGGRTIAGDKIIEDPDYPQLLRENIAAIRKGRQIHMMIMVAHPYRGSIKVDYDKDLIITKVHKPYFWD